MTNNTEKFPAPAYAKTVLEANFEDGKRFFLDSLFEIHYAHGVMLVRQGLLDRDEAASIFRVLRSIDRAGLDAVKYDGSSEDLFFHIEELLANAVGIDVAGKLHTARSRNDIDITLYRMEIRNRLLRITGEVLELASVIADSAASHVHAVMPAHTHTQPAQPTTLGHYLAAVVEVLQRDATRLQSAFATVNCNPLGSCAITTTGFPIDRDVTTDLLGFDGLQVNSYGAIAAVDYILESAGALSNAMVNLGKVIHDLLLWSMQEFGYLLLSDGFVQTSSIMPQKRNPVALEHARILASRAFAESQAIFSTAHNTPFGDIVDSEDDLFPLVFLAFEDASRVLELLSAVMRSARFNVDHMRARAGASFLTVTELADTLVRSEAISFRQAHGIVAAAVKSGDDSHERIVDDVTRSAPDLLGKRLRACREELLQALDPVEFVHRRTIPGGPAPSEVSRQLEVLATERDSLRRWLGSAEERMESKRVALLHATEEILAL